MFGKQLGEHMGTLGLYHHIPPGAIKGRCASMAPLIRPITPTLTICAALLGVGLTIATNAEQALPCTSWPLGHRHRMMSSAKAYLQACFLLHLAVDPILARPLKKKPGWAVAPPPRTRYNLVPVLKLEPITWGCFNST